MKMVILEKEKYAASKGVNDFELLMLGSLYDDYRTTNGHGVINSISYPEQTNIAKKLFQNLLGRQLYCRPFAGNEGWRLNCHLNQTGFGTASKQKFLPSDFFQSESNK